MTDREAGGSAVQWHCEWVAALDELELSVEDTRRLLATTTARSADPAPARPRPTPAGPAPAAASWEPPAGLGPMPDELRSRAQAILARQTATAQEILATLVGNRRQAALAARLETGSSMPKPAYVDCAV